jgi:phosphate starvation-inducible protein PhoH and related proteins
MTGKRSTIAMSRKKRKENCNKYRKKQQQGESYLRLVHSGNDLHRIRQKQVQIKPRNFSQDDLLGHLEDPETNIVFAVGPAGTGKTMISTLVGIQGLQNSSIDKFVVTRPAVSVDEQHGFLPGTLQEKMAPWTRPIFDIFEEYYNPQQIEYMLGDNKIEIAPLAYMRGRNFHHSYIIADEMQLSTPNQMKMLMTRIGEGSKLVITGDLRQADRGSDNGLFDFLEKIEGMNSSRIKIVRFDEKDIERHPVVEEVLKIYGDC